MSDSVGGSTVDSPEVARKNKRKKEREGIMELNKARKVVDGLEEFDDERPITVLTKQQQGKVETVFKRSFKNIKFLDTCDPYGFLEKKKIMKGMFISLDCASANNMQHKIKRIRLFRACQEYAVKRYQKHNKDMGDKWMKALTCEYNVIIEDFLGEKYLIVRR